MVFPINKPLYLFVGRSSSGKTTVASQLEEKYGCKQVFSYTTRKPRYEGEIGHIFITEEEFRNLGELAAYTLYNGHRYGTTFEQLNECNIYVIDVVGVQTLLEKCQGYNRPIRILYFDVNVYNRIKRMINRGDSDMQIVSRLLQDEKDDWHDQLDKLVWQYSENMDVTLQRINANGTLSEVLSQVLFYINKYREVSE